MNTKDVKELKKYFSARNVNISLIHGCLISDSGQVTSTFTQDLCTLPEEVRDQITGLFRKILSGKVGSSLIPLSIEYGGPEQERLESLLKQRLEDPETRDRMFASIGENASLEDGCMILASVNTFDLIVRTRDDEFMDSDAEFSCILYAVCPVKRKERMPLYFDPMNQAIYSQMPELNIGAPVKGFIYPAYTDGMSNVSEVLYYTKDTALIDERLINALFAPDRDVISAADQKADFNTALAEALGDDCSAQAVIEVHETIRAWSEEIESADMEHDVTCDDVAVILRDGGVSDENVERFRAAIDESIGRQGRVTPANLIPKKNTYEIGEIKVSVRPEQSDLIRSDVIDGRKCLIIFADDGVSVNGVDVRFPDLTETMTADGPDPAAPEE